MTELIWEGKYDKDGKRAAPVRIALPFQTVETVNESGQQRAAMRSLWEQGQPGEWRNRLIWGDKKYVLPSLLPEFAGKVNLIYIDPPFATGNDFSFEATLPQSDDSFIKLPNMIEQKAYRDTWGGGGTPICSGFMKRPSHSVTSSQRMAVSMYIAIGTWTLGFGLSWKRFSVRATS